jgi:hypothetical protein
MVGLAEWVMGGLRRDNMIMVVGGMGVALAVPMECRNDNIYISSLRLAPGINLCSSFSASEPYMDRFLTYSSCIYYEVKNKKMKQNTYSENSPRFIFGSEKVMK